MATIINTPSGARDSTDSSLGLILGVIIAIALVVLFFVYGLPALREGANTSGSGTNINVTVPTGGGSTEGAGSGTGAGPSY